MMTNYHVAIWVYISPLWGTVEISALPMMINSHDKIIRAMCTLNEVYKWPWGPGECCSLPERRGSAPRPCGADLDDAQRGVILP
jgi:hypothetical protein